MSWSCINPAEIVAELPHNNPVAARAIVEEAVKGKLSGVFRDGLWWGDERLWYGEGALRPFNLSPLLPHDFPIEHPEDMFTESERCLKVGDWERGWQLYEFRHQIEQGRAQIKRLFMPHWDGKARCRRLLVHAGQGVGDAIMFARYLMELDRRGIASDFLVEPPLAKLMRTLTYAGRIVTEIDERLYDYHLPAESLPLALGIYAPMRCDPYLRSQIQYFKPSGRIGICWAGQGFHPRNLQRCLTLEKIIEYVPEGAELVSFQVGEARRQLEFAPWIFDAGVKFQDWSDTAEMLARVDSLITVDTGIAHLAGAMGIPVKLIVTEPVEWRWGDGNTTPWYASMQIWRSPSSTPTQPTKPTLGTTLPSPCSSTSSPS